MRQTEQIDPAVLNFYGGVAPEVSAYSQEEIEWFGDSEILDMPPVKQVAVEPPKKQRGRPKKSATKLLPRGIGRKE